MVYLDFCKRALYVKISTPSMMVYSELGIVPPSVKRKYTVLKYWIKLLSSKNGILNSVYSDMLVSCSGDTVD